MAKTAQYVIAEYVTAEYVIVQRVARGRAMIAIVNTSGISEC